MLVIIRTRNCCFPLIPTPIIGGAAMVRPFGFTVFLFLKTTIQGGSH